MKSYIAEKLAFHEIHDRNYESLTDVLKAQYEFIRDEVASSAQSVSSESSSVLLAKFKKNVAEKSEKAKVSSALEAIIEKDGASNKKSRKQANKMLQLKSKLPTKLPSLKEGDSSGSPVASVINSSISSEKSVDFSKVGELLLSPLTSPPLSSKFSSFSPLKPAPGQLDLTSPSPMISSRSSRSTLSDRNVNASSKQPMSKEDFYKKLGVARGAARTSAGGALFPIAEAQKQEEYAPVLGTLKETGDTSIMYR